MKTILATAVLSIIGAASSSAQSLRGVWKPVEVVINKGPNAGRHTSDVQPGLLFFTDTHYSIMFVNGFQSRPHLSAEPTDDERGRVFQPFTANAGTYQFRDSIITRTPVVAKSPAVMAGNSYTSRVRVVADTIWFILTSADTVETRAKWVRIERLPAR
jgi:hypothetical protein